MPLPVRVDPTVTVMTVGGCKRRISVIRFAVEENSVCLQKSNIQKCLDTIHDDYKLYPGVPHWYRCLVLP
jgi:hypothetical protein